MNKCFKIPYNSLGEANKEATKLRGNLRAYQCKRCFKFHLTSISSKETKSINNHRLNSNPNLSLLREEVEFNTELINQLNNQIDQLNFKNKRLQRDLKTERDRSLLEYRIISELFKKYGNLHKEYKQLVEDNPFLTEKDFE